MTDLDVVERFQSIMGFGKIYTQKKMAKEHWKTAYQFRITGFEKFQAAVAMLWPWLGERRRARAVELLQRFR